jgi:hypothetical protein
MARSRVSANPASSRSLTDLVRVIEDWETARAAKITGETLDR